MFIKEVCEECKLTKKAIEYYEQQGLIFPSIEDNGYRNYSADDIATLKEISVLRKLSISVADIKDILISNNKSVAISKCKYKMELEMEKAMAKKTCLEQLVYDYDIDKALSYVEEHIDKHFTIKEMLLHVFPGNYGLYLCIHFGPFLNGRIDTDSKEEAYRKIVDYLDYMESIEFPKDLEEYLVQIYGMMDQAEIEKVNEASMQIADITDNYLEENKNSIEEYLKLRTSEEFKDSPMYRIQQSLLQFQQSNGYYDILIPNIKVLSDSYREYSEKLERANELFLNKYPSAKELYK